MGTNLRIIKILLSVIICLMLSLGMLPCVPAYHNVYAEEALVNDRMIIVPENAIYYGGHTYAVFWVQDSTWNWERQEAFCEELGVITGVNAHLATLGDSGENSAVMELIRETIGEEATKSGLYDPCSGFAIGALEAGGSWQWISGETFGLHYYTYDENGQVSGAEYLPMGYDSWCVGAHNGFDHSGTGREPNIWIGPYRDQHYAYASLNNWHNEVNLAGGAFICEFEGEVSFVYSEVNYDMDYFAQTGLYPVSQNVYSYNPGIYSDLNSSYRIAKPIKRSDLLSSSLKENPLQKQPLGQYPVHPEKHFNFHGWSYKSYDGQRELYGNKTKEPMKIWDYNSMYPFMYLYEDPIVVLHAVWEDTSHWVETNDESSAATYLAMCRLSYVLGDDSQGPYRGQYIGEMLNAFYLRANDTKDLEKLLPQLKNDEKVNAIDFMYATIGGWMVNNWLAGDSNAMEKESGWSFFATSIGNNTGSNAVIYRGTIPGIEPKKLDSLWTDKLLGVDGILNYQFNQAINFYQQNRDERTFVVGHSLGGALASHVALTRRVNAHTYNSAEGWTIPLTIRNNYLTHEFIGNDKMQNLDPWIYKNDLLVGTHSKDFRNYHEINLPNNPLDLLENHGMEISLTYENGEYSIGDSEYKPYQNEWDYFTGSIATALNSEDSGGDIEVYLGTSGNDEYRSQISSLTSFQSIFAFGGEGNDTLITGPCDDKLIGGRGNNTLMGVWGKDEYIIMENPNGLTIIEDPDDVTITVVNLDITDLQKDNNGYTLILSDGQIVKFDTGTSKHTVIQQCLAPEYLAWSKDTKPQYLLYWKAPQIDYSENNLVAEPTSSSVLVDGKDVAFDAYNINGNNYFKLRDLAYILSGTGKQFEVSWDGTANIISLASGKPYTEVGGEMMGQSAESKAPMLTSSRINLDGREVSLTAYNIDGNNYFKLRDVGMYFDFGVTWDDPKNTIVIDTSVSYTPN